MYQNSKYNSYWAKAQYVNREWVHPYRPLEGGMEVPMGDLQYVAGLIDGKEVPVWQYCDNACGSDYTGSTAALANYKYLRHFFRDSDYLVFTYGGYASYGVLVREDLPENSELGEIIASLSEYPVISDDFLSEVETELADEAWDNSIKLDFAQKLREVAQDWPEYEQVEAILDKLESLDKIEDGYGGLYEYFRGLAEKANVYWEAENIGGSNMWINYCKVANAATFDNLTAYVKGEVK